MTFDDDKPKDPTPHVVARAFLPNCGRSCRKCGERCVLAAGHQVTHHCGNGHSF